MSAILLGMLLAAVCASPSQASVGTSNAATTHGDGWTHHKVNSHRKRDGRRVGGPVRKAWPKGGRKPSTRLTRWLARQVGPAKAKPCKKHKRASKRCNRRAPRAAMSTAGGDPGSPIGTVAQIAGTPTSGSDGPIASTSARFKPLELARSYEIPTDDPSYARLLNWSWTYDSAVAAAAFASTDDRSNAGQLLDQLAALQHTDGSIEIAFNVATGESAPIFRSGTSAWVGLAATTYDRAFRTTRYVDTAQRTADYLLSLQGPNGLILGGPKVEWASTQHNLIAYVLFVRLAEQLRKNKKTTPAAARYESAAAELAAAIDANLLLTDKAGTRFRQGMDDDTQALDVQALGAMYLQGTDQTKLAEQVLAYAQSAFAVSDRSVVESKDPATYNMTYAAPGPFSGYAPYTGDDTPNVLWAEGNAEMRLALAAVGQDTSAIDKDISAWSAITKSADQGMLQANETVSSGWLGVEYHVWPASTATAWTVLSQSDPAFFAAPLTGGGSID